MCKISKILRNFFAVKSLVAFFIIGLLVLLPAGDFNLQPYYANAQGFGETSPPDSGGPTGSTGSAPAGGQTGAAPGLAGATSVVSGVVSAVASTPTSLGFAANVALGNAPTAAQTGSVIGSVIGNIAGSMIGGPLGGLIGGIIGGIIGGLIGSLFGGKGGGDPDASPTSDPDPEGSPIGPMGSDPSGGGCFKAGTFIATAISADGIIDFREIETLKSGDEIIGVIFDPEGNPVLKSAQVLRPLRHEPIEYQFSKLVAADGSAIVGTNNHVIITDARNAGTRIENLVSGQTIVTVGTAGEWNSVAEVTSIGAEVVPVFNVETTTENYLVSLDGRQWILVHNGGGK